MNRNWLAGLAAAAICVVAIAAFADTLGRTTRGTLTALETNGASLSNSADQAVAVGVVAWDTYQAGATGSAPPTQNGNALEIQRDGSYEMAAQLAVQAPTNTCARWTVHVNGSPVGLSGMVYHASGQGDVGHAPIARAIAPLAAGDLVTVEVAGCESLSVGGTLHFEGSGIFVVELSD